MSHRRTEAGRGGRRQGVGKCGIARGRAMPFAHKRRHDELTGIQCVPKPPSAHTAPTALTAYTPTPARPLPTPPHRSHRSTHW